MSILSLKRSPLRPSEPAPAPRWWGSTVRQPSDVEASAPPAANAAWWNWNPYRRPAASVDAAERRQGYGQGVRDERRVLQRRQRSGGHPIIATVLIVAAVCGVAFLGLAYEEGSFSAGGAVVDQKMAEVRDDVFGAVGRAGDQSGAAVQDVGKSISNKSLQLTQKGR